MKNIRSKTIQTTFLDLKICWNQAQKPPEKFKKLQISEALQIQASKASKNFYHKIFEDKEHEEHMNNTNNK